MLSLQFIQENVISTIKKERCCNGRSSLSARFIEQQKKEQEEQFDRIARRNRRKIWQHKYRELSNLCAELVRSQQTYRHYLSYAREELVDLGPDTGTFVGSPSDNILIRSKAFFDATATGWGRNEAEYYQFQDGVGNMVRRPFWIRIESTADIRYVLRKMGYLDSDYVRRLEEPGSLEGTEHNRRYANRTPLRTGPILRPEVDDVLSTNLGLRFTPSTGLNPGPNPGPGSRPERTLLFGKPMYHALDHSKYNVKSTSNISKTFPTLETSGVAELEVKRTEYKEHSLLTKNPRVVYTKMEWTHNDKKYVDLYDEDDTLMERTVTWSPASDETSSALSDTLSFEDWYVYSIDVVTRIHSKIIDGYNYFISMFVTKKGEYEVEIDNNNQATVKVEEEKKITVEGLIGYKAAVTEDRRRCLIEMVVPKDARVASGVHAAGKFRTDKVVPMKIYLVETATSSSTSSTSSSTTSLEVDMTLVSSNMTVAIPCVYANGVPIKYTVGEELKVDNNNFYHHMDEVCRPGIHYCMTKREALDFHLRGGQTLNKIIEA